MKQVNLLKQFVILASNEKSFVHHKWFVKYHLVIVEQIALELCEIYKEADKDLVLAILWLHDYGKILGLSDTPSVEIKTRELMATCKFEDYFIDKILKYLEIFESKMDFDLRKAPLEVKIVSSADGASHLVGPFNALRFYENSDKPIEELLEGRLEKIKKDWDRKIVLPEVKKAFRDRNDFVAEGNGKFPAKFIR